MITELSREPASDGLHGVEAGKCVGAYGGKDYFQANCIYLTIHTINMPELWIRKVCQLGTRTKQLKIGGLYLHGVICMDMAGTDGNQQKQEELLQGDY